MTHAPSSLGRRSVSGAAISVVARYAAKVVNLVSVALLARMLSPEAFGVAAGAFAVIGLLEVPGLGLGSALVVQEGSERARRTAFWLALLVGCLVGVIVFATAPLSGAYFGDPDATDAVRILSLTFPLLGLTAVPEGILLKELRFGRAFLPEIGMALAKAGTSLTLALLDFGVFALVFGQLAGVFVRTALVWLATWRLWRPRRGYDRREVGPLGGYAAHIFGIHLLGTWMLNVDYFFIGRHMGVAALGIYAVAFRLPELAVKELFGGISRALFPVYVAVNTDRAALAEMFTRATVLTAAITVPTAAGLAVTAGPVVEVVFGDDWSAAADVLPALALYMMLRSLYFNVGAVLKAVGRPGVLTAVNAVSVVIATPALWWAAVHFRTITAVAWTHVVLAVVFGVFQQVVASRVLALPSLPVAKGLIPVALSAAVMAVVVVGLRGWTESFPLGVELALSVGLGVIAYAGASLVLQRANVRQVLSLLPRSDGLG